MNEIINKIFFILKIINYYFFYILLAIFGSALIRGTYKLVLIDFCWKLLCMLTIHSESFTFADELFFFINIFSIIFYIILDIMYRFFPILFLIFLIIFFLHLLASKFAVPCPFRFRPKTEPVTL